MYEVELIDFANMVVYSLFFVTGIVYGLSIGPAPKNSLEKMESRERVKALRLLDNLFSSPDCSISYDKNSKILDSIKDLGGRYYYGALIFDPDESGIEDLDKKIEIAFDLVEEVS